MLKLMASAFSGFSCRVVAKVPVPVPMSCPQTVGAKSSAEERERKTQSEREDRQHATNRARGIASIPLHWH